jgi:hypothetical protein
MPLRVWACDLHVMLFESAEIAKPPTACLRCQPFRSVNTNVKPSTWFHSNLTPPFSMAPIKRLTVSSLGLPLDVSKRATVGIETPDLSANSCCDQLSAPRPARMAAASTWKFDCVSMYRILHYGNIILHCILSLLRDTISIIRGDLYAIDATFHRFS